MVNSNIGPNSAPLRDIRLWNLSDLDFDLSRSLKVKSNGAVGLSIYEFLLMFNSNQISISHHLGDICIWKFSPYLLSLGQNFADKLLVQLRVVQLRVNSIMNCWPLNYLNLILDLETTRLVACAVHCVADSLWPHNGNCNATVLLSAKISTITKLLMPE